MKTRLSQVRAAGFDVHARLLSALFALMVLAMLANSAKAQVRYVLSGHPTRSQSLIVTEAYSTGNVVYYTAPTSYYSGTYAEEYVPGDSYLYDYVNRAPALTPEPVWRSMFPGLRARIAAERREFGVNGQSAREAIYFRAIEARRRQQAAAAAAAAQTSTTTSNSAPVILLSE